MYRPKDRDELEKLIMDCYRDKLYLLDIDTSLVTDMSDIFNYHYYKKRYKININDIWENPNNDISQWNISVVTDINYMFVNSKFNGDISNWNTSNITNMMGMFWGSEFNRDISPWDVSNVTYMNYMFNSSKFNHDLSPWILSLDSNVSMVGFNIGSKHEKIYGEINGYGGFIKTVKWDSIKQHIKEILKNSSNKERYEILKKLNSFRQFSDIELDISNINIVKLYEPPF